jgi:membrane associated rhomboid family serine protease
MNTLSGSIDTSSFGSLDGSGSSQVVDDDYTPSPETLREIHEDGVRAKRSQIRWALACLVPSAALTYARRGSIDVYLFLFADAVGLAWLAAATFVWWRLRRADPLQEWLRERRQDIEEAAAISEHATRTAAVTPVASYAILTMVIAVTAVQFFGPGVRASIELAALVKPAVRAGEWWRLLTATYMHASVWHIFGNGSALLALGTLIETYDRRIRLPLAYLAGAIGGCLASTMLMEDSSVGASGAILGLAGYLLTAGVGPRSSPAWMRKRLYGALWLTLVTGLLGYFFIDNAGHAGGVLAGLGIGLLAARANRDRSGQWARTLDACGWTAAGVLVAGAIFTIGRLVQAW